MLQANSASHQAKPGSDAGNHESDALGMKSAKRMEHIPFSAIRKVLEAAAAKEKLGQEVIHLEIGRPDFDTPVHIKEQAKQALDLGRVHYTSNYGILELRREIARKLDRQNGLVYDPEGEITVTVGSNEAVFMAMMALLDPGDEVLVVDPCWLHYFYCATLAGAVAVSVPARSENDFIPTMEDFRSCLSARTRMVVVNSPNNPTGAVYPESFFKELAALACEHNLLVLSDEIYEDIIYAGARHHSIAGFPGMKPRTILVNGFSKNYAMTGWRLGYAAADRELTRALIRVHQYTTVCATTFAQWGGVAALAGGRGVVDEMVAQFERRMQFVYRELGAMPGVKVIRPRGAFYFMADISSFGLDSEQMSTYLLEEAGCATVPGAGLGRYGHNYIRISYANSMAKLRVGMQRIQNALQKLAA